MNKISVLFFGLFALAVLIGCENKIGKLEPKAPVGLVCDSIKYSTHIQPIIVGKCATSNCHVSGGTGNGDFTTHAGVAAKAVQIKDRINSNNNPMPPTTHGGKMSQSRIDSIECWIDKGVPNN